VEFHDSIRFNDTKWMPIPLTQTKGYLYSSYKISCDEYFYGSLCRKRCKPQDTAIGGHYKCTSNGDRECLPGWYDNYCISKLYHCVYTGYQGISLNQSLVRGIIYALTTILQ